MIITNKDGDFVIKNVTLSTGKKGEIIPFVELDMFYDTYQEKDFIVKNDVSIHGNAPYYDNCFYNEESGEYLPLTTSELNEVVEKVYEWDLSDEKFFDDIWNIYYNKKKRGEIECRDTSPRAVKQRQREILAEDCAKEKMFADA